MSQFPSRRAIGNSIRDTSAFIALSKSPSEKDLEVLQAMENQLDGRMRVRSNRIGGILRE